MSEKAFYITVIICGVVFFVSLITGTIDKKHGVKFFFSCLFILISILVAVSSLFVAFPPKAQDVNKEKNALMAGEVSDTLTFDDLEITVNNYVFSKNLGNIKGLTKAGDGNVWCTVYLDVKNVSKTTKSLCSSFNTNYSFTLEYKDGYTYYSTHQDYSEFLYAHEDIAALETLRNVCVSFEVPLEVEKNTDEPLHIKVSKNSKSAKDYAEWKLR